MISGSALTAKRLPELPPGARDEMLVALGEDSASSAPPSKQRRSTCPSGARPGYFTLEKVPARIDFPSCAAHEAEAVQRMRHVGAPVSQGRRWRRPRTRSRQGAWARVRSTYAASARRRVTPRQRITRSASKRAPSAVATSQRSPPAAGWPRAGQDHAAVRKAFGQGVNQCLHPVAQVARGSSARALVRAIVAAQRATETEMIDRRSRRSSRGARQSWPQALSSDPPCLCPPQRWATRSSASRPRRRGRSRPTLVVLDSASDHEVHGHAELAAPREER